MSIVILFAGTLTFHRRDAMRCDRCRSCTFQLDRPPPTWVPTSNSTAHTSCMFIYKFVAPDYKIGLRGWMSVFFFGFLHSVHFCWPRVTSTTMTRTFKICSTDPGGAGRARWSKTHSHGPLIGTMPQYGLQINWPESIAAESPKSYLSRRPRADMVYERSSLHLRYPILCYI